MDQIQRERPPGKLTAIGVMHLIGGIMNLILAFTWFALGGFSGLLTFGIGCVYCCPSFVLFPVGIAELVSGIKHMAHDHRGLEAPRATAIFEILSILGGSMTSMVFGILTLVFIADPEVERYYLRRTTERPY